MVNVWDPNKKSVQDTPQAPLAPLSRDAFIDPNTGAERPINNSVTNPNAAADVQVGQDHAVVNRQIDAIAHDTTMNPTTKLAQIKALTATKIAPVGITPEMRQQVVAQQNLPQNQAIPSVTRDLKAETSTMNQYGLDKNNPQDVASGYEVTYKPAQLTSLLERGQIDSSVFGADKLQQLGITPERVQQLLAQTTDPAAKQHLQSLYDQIQKTGAMGAQVESTMNATPKPTNQMMGVLSEALNAKSNFKNQQLGTSDLFKAAGLSGYSVLAQSMNQRMNEMQDKAKSAQNLVAESGGAMATTYKAISDNYNKIMDEYDKQTKMLLDIDQRAKDHEDAMALLDKQQANEKATYEWKQQIDAKTLQKVTLEGHDYMVDGNGNVHNVIGADGKVVAGVDYTQDNPEQYAPIKSAPKGTIYLGGKLLDDSTYNGIFNVGGYGGQCGTWASTVSTAKKVGNTWNEKKQAIDKRDNPQVGDKLLLPLNAGTDGKGAGHVAVVTGYDSQTGDIQVVQANMDYKGTITRGSYNINDLTAKYGDNFGFASGELKSATAQQISKAGNLADDAIQKIKKDGGWLGGMLQPTAKILGVMTPVGQTLNNMAKTTLDQTALPGHAVTYDEQVSPYLVQEPKTQLDRQVNMIIQQKATFEDLFGTAKSEKVVAQKQALMDAVSQRLGGDFSPTNLTANVAIRKTYDTMMTKFRAGFNINESNLIGELQNLKALSAKYPRSSTAILNDIQNISKFENSDPTYAKFLNAINTTADSYGKIMSGTGMGNAQTAVSFKNQALDMLSKRMGDGGLNAQIDQINFEMQNKAKSLINQDMTDQLYPISSLLPTGGQLSQTKGQMQGDPLADYRSQLQPGEVLVTDGQGNYLSATAQDLASNPNLKQV